MTTKITDIAADVRQRHSGAAHRAYEKKRAHAGQHGGNVEALDELLALPDVMALTSLSRASIYRAMDQGLFPRSVRVSRARIAWRASDIRAWVDDLPQSAPEAA
jgi:prophage regulatory protein